LRTGTPDEVGYHVQYNKSAVKEIIKKFPGKEVSALSLLFFLLGLCYYLVIPCVVYLQDY